MITISIFIISMFFVVLALIFFGIFLSISGIVTGTTTLFLKNKTAKPFFGIFSAILFLAGLVMLLPFSLGYLAPIAVTTLLIILCISISILAIVGIFFSKRLDTLLLKTLLIGVYMLIIILSLSCLFFFLFFLI
ncbi:hypothetical protein ID741_003512 [Enterococcus sp. AZ103]